MTTDAKKISLADAGNAGPRDKARERKKRFDARMRNADASGARRHAVVVYLTNDAKQVLGRNRQRRRLLDLPPMLDSVLIEELLVAYGAQGEVDVRTDSLVIDETTKQTDTLKLFKTIESQIGRIKALELHNLAAEETIAILEHQEVEAMEFRPFDWSGAESDLLEANRYLMSHVGYRLAIRLQKRLSAVSNESHAARIFNEEITDYIEHVIEIASSS